MSKKAKCRPRLEKLTLCGVRNYVLYILLSSPTLVYVDNVWLLTTKMVRVQGDEKKKRSVFLVNPLIRHPSYHLLSCTYFISCFKHAYLLVHTYIHTNYDERTLRQPRQAAFYEL